MLLEELVENGELDACVAVVEQDDRHAPAAGHLDTQTVHDACEQDRLRLRIELIEPCGNESAKLTLVCPERMPGQVIADSGLFVLQQLTIAPAWYVHERHSRSRLIHAAEQAHLIYR